MGHTKDKVLELLEGAIYVHYNGVILKWRRQTRTIYYLNKAVHVFGTGSKFDSNPSSYRFATESEILHYTVCEKENRYVRTPTEKEVELNSKVCKGRKFVEDFGNNPDDFVYLPQKGGNTKAVRKATELLDTHIYVTISGNTIIRWGGQDNRARANYYPKTGKFRLGIGNAGVWNNKPHLYRKPTLEEFKLFSEKELEAKGIKSVGKITKFSERYGHVGETKLWEDRSMQERPLTPSECFEKPINTKEKIVNVVTKKKKNCILHITTKTKVVNVYHNRKKKR